MCKNILEIREFILIFGSGWILFDIWKQDSWQNENYAQILRVDSPGYLHKYWESIPQDICTNIELILIFGSDWILFDIW